MAKRLFKVTFRDGRIVTYEGDAATGTGYSNIQFTGAFVGLIHFDGTMYYHQDEVKSIEYLYTRP